MVNMQEAVKSAFSHSFDWKGRASRPAFWWLYLAEIIAIAVAAILESVIFSQAGVLTGIVALVFILPVLSALVRRLHDTGRSGWWFWIQLVPFIGQIWLLVLLVLPSETKANEYGPDPKGATSEPKASK